MTYVHNFGQAPLTRHEADTRKPLRTHEQNEVMGIFMNMLLLPTGDGGSKRARGEKPSWKVDGSHMAAAYRHLDPSRERYDEDSGAHKFIHAAWRLLAIAYQDMVRDGLVEPEPESQLASRITRGETEERVSP